MEWLRSSTMSIGTRSQSPVSPTTTPSPSNNSSRTFSMRSSTASSVFLARAPWAQLKEQDAEKQEALKRDEEELNAAWRDVPVVAELRGGFRLSGVVAGVSLSRGEISLSDVHMLSGHTVVRTGDCLTLPSRTLLRIWRTPSLDVDVSLQLDDADALTEAERQKNLRVLSSGRIEQWTLVDTAEGLRETMQRIDRQLLRSSERIVAVDVEGVDLGRDGSITLVQLATDKEVFLFDILTLGDDAFHSGLGILLEDGQITKIMHDCRKDSDALWHLHKVRLAGVFDCQVSDLLVRRNMTGQMPAYVHGYAACLERYLGLKTADLAVKQEGKRFMEDPRAWEQRPLPEPLLRYAAFDVAFLRPLYDVLIEMLALEQHIATQTYLDVVRDHNRDTANVVPNFESGMLRYLFRNMRPPAQGRSAAERAAEAKAAEVGGAPLADDKVQDAVDE